jgi:hypothetical protein
MLSATLDIWHTLTQCDMSSAPYMWRSTYKHINACHHVLNNDIL